MDVAITPELLRQHGEFVRKLARALLADPAQAEDVAQEALARWATQPPRDASRPRAWLTTVVRRLAANSRRAAERRARHEQQAFAPVEASSPLEAAEQAELVQRVVAAVMELEPAQRDTILSLYFRSLTVRELAAETSSSEDTVRTRERRALERMRAKLDRHFGARAAWALGLGRLAERLPAPAPIAGGGPGTEASFVKFAGGLALATVAAVSWIALRDEDPQDGAGTPESSLLVRGQVAAPDASTGEPDSAPLDTRTVRAPSNAPIQGEGGSSSAPGDPSSTFSAADTAEIRGTFLLEGGAPAAHVPWGLQGWEANQQLVSAHGLPEDWIDPSGETDANGSFSLRLVPPRAYQFVFWVKAPGHAEASWRWGEIEPGGVLELGTVTLARGATVTGRLLDGAGTPLLGQPWTVRVESRGLAEAEGRQDVSVWAELDPATGAYCAEDVMPGSNELSASHRVGGSTEGPRVLAVAGAIVAADLVHSGPDVTRRILVRPFCSPLPVSDGPGREHIRLLAPDGSWRTAQDVKGSARSFAFDELAPGAYALTIDDPRFEFWSQAGVVPGTAVSARLEPCSTVVLSVVDPAGQPLTLDSLSLERGHDDLRHEIPLHEFPLHEGPAPFDGRVALVPGDFTLHVRAGELEGEVDVRALGFDETRAVTLTLGVSPMLRGRVTAADGAGLEGVQVFLLRPAPENDSLASPILPSTASTGAPQFYRQQLDAVESGADGSFAFRLRRGGAFVVYAELPNGLCADTPVLSLEEGEGREDVSIALPPGAAVTGTVRSPDGASCAGLRLWIGPVLKPYAGLRQMLAPDEHARTLSADGSFAFDGLPAGALQVLLLLPENAHPKVATHGGGWNRIELERIEIAVGETLTRDFVATLPGTFTLEVLVNGVPAAGSGFAIEYPYSAPYRPFFHATLDGNGRYGPALLFPGPWSVRVNEATGMQPVALDVPAGDEVPIVIDLPLRTGTVQFLDAAGGALAGLSVSVFVQSGEGPPLSCARATTDAQGRASFTLVPGTHLVRLDAGSGRPSYTLAPEDVAVPLTWSMEAQSFELRF